MKTFRPYNAGYLIIYILTLISFADVSYTIITYDPNAAQSLMNSFALWSFLILIAAVVFANHYFKTRVTVGSDYLHIVRPVYVQPKPGEKRVNFLFRQDTLDNVIMETRLQLPLLEKYGYIEDLGFKSQDKGGATQKNKLFPLHEVAFVLGDGTNYRLNAAVYSKKQLASLISLIKEKTGIAPTGSLANP
ncbi:MAG: hypothetical protein RSA12_02905 [Clostridia bacterium]